MPLPIKIEYRVGIQTPAEVIWKIVADIPGWSDWNPLYPKAAGQLQFGGVLELEMVIPGEKPRAIRPTIVDWTPNEQIIWKTSQSMGMLTTTRYIEVEALSETGCIFSNGEFFEGQMIRFFSRRQRKAVKEGFAAFGEAVRERAEAAWRSGAPETT